MQTKGCPGCSGALSCYQRPPAEHRASPSLGPLCSLWAWRRSMTEKARLAIDQLIESTTALLRYHYECIIIIDSAIWGWALSISISIVTAEVSFGSPGIRARSLPISIEDIRMSLSTLNLISIANRFWARFLGHGGLMSGLVYNSTFQNRKIRIIMHAPAAAAGIT